MQYCKRKRHHFNTLITNKNAKEIICCNLTEDCYLFQIDTLSRCIWPSKNFHLSIVCVTESIIRHKRTAANFLDWVSVNRSFSQFIHVQTPYLCFCQNLFEVDFYLPPFMLITRSLTTEGLTQLNSVAEAASDSKLWNYTKRHQLDCYYHQYTCHLSIISQHLHVPVDIQNACLFFMTVKGEYRTVLLICEFFFFDIIKSLKG